MAPTSKSSKGSSDAPPPSKSSHYHHSKSQDRDRSNVGSPSSKSHGNNRNNGDGTNKGRESGRSSHHHHHHNRRRRSSLKSSLQETLSSFGDDVIKVKNWPAGLAGYDNHGYFQPEVSFNIPASQDSLGERDDSPSTAAPFGDIPATSLENGGVENELALIMSQHYPNFQTKNFEKVHPDEVGVRASKWQKLLQASVSSNRFQKLRKQDRERTKKISEVDHCLEQFYDSNGKISFDPPFWGVARPTRTKISFLSLSLILHELACFTSCVLLGCMIFQGMEAISWIQQKPFTDNWVFFKWYSSFQTILVVITCLGFLNRVDTTEQRSLWLLPLFLVPVLCLSVSDYCNKAWELQRLECHNFYNLDPASKLKVHLTQDCSSVFSMLDMLNVNSTSTNNVKALQTSLAQQHILAPALNKFATELEVRGIASFIMRILSAVSTIVISSYLFCCRKNHYLVDTFGPPREFVGNIDLVLEFTKNENILWDSHKTSDGQERDEEDDGMNVIYQRAAKIGRNK